MTLQEIVNITDNDGLVQTYQNVGNTVINKGDIVVISTTDLTIRGIAQTTNADNSMRKGIAVESINIGAEGSIVILGRASANVQTGATAVVVGDKLGTSANAGKLGLATTNPLCVALQAVAANTSATILVEVMP